MKKKSPTAEKSSAARLPRTIRPHRILVVDDEPDIRRLNAEVLSDSGYQVDSAKDGAAAWEALQIKSYDLLITDNSMPKMSGVELLRKLHHARIALPVIMISGTMPVEELKREPWLQIHSMLCKPYTLTELLGKVKDILNVMTSDRQPVD
jgi:DNA-binding response OmpR family regulator